MSREELYIQYHGLFFSKEAHSVNSLKFAQEFSFENDVIAVTYPKSGTVWMAPWLENNRLAMVVDKLKSPRVLVTHFPYHLMPRALSCICLSQAIYVMRNPKDIIVSFYYFHQMTGFWKIREHLTTYLFFCSLQKKMNKTLWFNVLLLVVFGKWTDHVKSWKHNNLGDRIMFITYEEMKEDLPAALRRISSFLGKNLSDETIHTIAEHCSFNAMKDNPMSNFSLVPKTYMDSDKSTFFRKGVVGDWKNHFTPEQLSRFTSTINKEMEGESFSLPWSLD
uniref:Sulfotransferase n=1 Tax=Neogobius melanostomus TaxID=47308 RepID=A0A8C6SQ13_9GOBI